MANHNAYLPQDVVLSFGEISSTQIPMGAEIFDRAEGVWKELPWLGHEASFELGPGYGELVRPIWVWGLPSPMPTSKPGPPLAPEPTPAGPSEGEIYLPSASPGR